MMDHLTRLRGLVSAVIGAGLCTACMESAPADYAFDSFDRCEPVFAETVKDIGIEPGRYQSPYISVRRFGGGGSQPFSGNASDTVTGYEAWHRLNDCTGHLVVVADRYCRILQAYVSGDCTVAELDDWR